MSDENGSFNKTTDLTYPKLNVLEETLIANMTSFLEANGATEVDKEVLRNMAESLTRRLNDTSPGTLHDVKMDNPYGVGYHSPCSILQPYQGCSSPAVQGRSVREYEEQMTNIRKENFNLKLRLYFLEESIPGYHNSANSGDGQETLMRQLIDCKVEMEVLRKELNEKQSLLQDAAAAIGHIEKVLKETEIKHQEELNDLKQKLEYYENKCEVENNPSISNEDFMERSDMVENLNALQRIQQLEELLRLSNDKLLDFQNQITELDEILAKRDETIKEYEEKVKELVFQNNELLETAESKDKDATINEEEQQLADEIQKNKIELADKACMIMELEEKLANQDSLYEKAKDTIQKLILNIKSLKTELSQLKGQNASQSNITKSSNQKETTCGNVIDFGPDSTCLDRDTADINATQNEKFEKIIEQQEATIQKLQSEVKKKTADLQNLVNKELWEKNREIERLNKMFNNKTATTTVNDSNAELHSSLPEAEYAKAVQRNKLLQRKVDILIQRLDAERNSGSVITQLRNDYKKAREDAEAADKWRKECSEFCTILSTRLEELAGFLNSLLKHKDVLGFLAADKRKAMRRAVDRSLDLSKSFNMTLSVSGISAIDQSLTELSNRSGLLDAFEASMANETFNSHEDINVNKSESLENLKVENKVLQRELEKRRSAETKKERRNLPLSVNAENRESESEAWSEPDRKVSMARIGLEDHSGSLMVAKEQPPVQQTESDSDCNTSAQLDSRSAKSRAHERIMHLEQVIQQRDKRIEDIQSQLLDAENRVKLEIANVSQLTEEIEEMKLRHKTQLDDLVENEQLLKQALVESEITARNMQRQIDESTLNASRATTERVKALNEKLQVEKRMQEVTQQLTLCQADYSQLQQHAKRLESEQKVFSERLAKAEAAAIKAAAKQSGYTSEEVPMTLMATTGGKAVNAVPPFIMGEQRVNNSSPDLGIESDPCRVSSSELSNLQRPSLKTLEFTTDCEGNTIQEYDNTNPKNSSSFKKHDCTKVDQEIIDLRHKLLRTKRAFEDTYQKLHNSNLRKAQVEKDIKNQILKTHNVLRNVRSNMENETALKTEPHH